jgi:hypothetical protein
MQSFDYLISASSTPVTGSGSQGVPMRKQSNVFSVINTSGTFSITWQARMFGSDDTAWTYYPVTSGSSGVTQITITNPGIYSIVPADGIEIRPLLTSTTGSVTVLSQRCA